METINLIFRKNYKQFLIVVIISVLNCINLECKAQKGIEFKVYNIKEEINSLDQALVSFKLCNNSNKTYIIPSVISYNSISDKNPNINIGYEVYRKEESKNSFVLLDSCFIHNNPLIPEEGIVINKYKRRNCFFYESQLPIICIYKKGSYKIRFTFFLKEENGKKNKIISKWYCFKVNQDLL